MSNYTKSTDFATKDTLASGNPAKIIKGTEINTEFVNVQTAVNSKADGNIAGINAAIAGGTINQGTIDGGSY
jgi:glucose-6-phosphate dehydrogenase assembly protein OpcA